MPSLVVKVQFKLLIFLSLPRYCAMTRPPTEQQPPRVRPVTCLGDKYIFDRESYSWKKTDTVVCVTHPDKPLASGSMRVCYEVEEIDVDGGSSPMVAKIFMQKNPTVNSEDYFNEGKTQCMCEEFADNFNRLHVTGVHKPNISFLQCYVVLLPRDNIPPDYQDWSKGFFSYKTQDTQEVMFVMEPKLDGHFTKYNNNNGKTYPEDPTARLTPSQSDRRTAIFEAAEAFSHFSLAESGGSMLVCDLQGVHDFLTDPQILMEDGKGLGMGNVGQKGIDKWVKVHQCNAICKALGLQPLHGVAPSSVSRQSNHYVGLRAQLQMQNPVRPQDLIPLSKPLDQMTEEERIEYAIKLSNLTS
ncbi:myosin-heavy-chain kinase [Angomonas deanei]|uniref:Alpha-kinase family, putative n=1 Tax=Angomonas deanei TaxID=59799 RepID=A0A7G2C544_9TRYP|nr:myosin-heavy-chain kinase [Angomonas deanei]CAD2213022.1 Alpha-kinase family, putative [Angomonas deanei]|eukprot:EPY33944.1 myosin-heavy-chain kinase [Angomonas deanei]